MSCARSPTSGYALWSIGAATAGLPNRVGDPVLIEEVGMALRSALFEEGLDVGRSEVVEPIAGRFGLEPLDAETRSATLHADWDEGRTRGVMGSPHFLTGDGGSWFCPGLDISRDNLGNFVIAWKQRTEAFVESVFG